MLLVMFSTKFKLNNLRKSITKWCEVQKMANPVSLTAVLQSLNIPIVRQTAS